jgi:hypothetical protein
MSDDGQASATRKVAYALITPAGELHWHPLASGADVEAIVGGAVAPGALATATVAGSRIPGRGPLKVLASDIALLFPDQYEPNPLAEAVLRALSGGRVSQAWRGSVALVEYMADPVTGEVLWPGEMSPRWIDVVSATVRRAQGTPGEPRMAGELVNVKQAQAVLLGLAGAVTDPVTHPADWDAMVSLAVQYGRRLGVSRDVINEARTMTVEQLVRTALGLDPQAQEDGEVADHGR